MQFLCSDGQNNLPCALFPCGLFHHLSTHPLSDESSQKGAKGRGLISSLLLSIILEDFAVFLMNLLFIYLKPQAYNRLITQHHVCPLLPPPLPPSPASALSCVQFSCQPLSAAALQASSFVQPQLPEVHSVRAVTMTCSQRMLLRAALVTLCFHLLCCQIVSPVMALVHQTYSPCKYPQAGNPLADGLHDLLQKALNLQLCVVHKSEGRFIFSALF